MDWVALRQTIQFFLRYVGSFWFICLIQCVPATCCSPTVAVLLVVEGQRKERQMVCVGCLDFGCPTCSHIKHAQSL